LVKGSQVVIVPPYLVPFYRTLGGKLAEQPLLNPNILEEQVQGEPVNVDYKDTPLADVLRDIADSTGTNIVLDPRLKENGKTPITATLQNVRLFTALKVLADMADLQPVVIGNVYYVTSRPNAERLEFKEWPQPEPLPTEILPAQRPQPPATKKGG
jgi:type II secretory pathway component HofQ